jgi:electron transport complex protein RnfC
MREYTPDRHLTGGLRLPAHKLESTSNPIRRGLLPSRVVLSLRQQHGPAMTPIVEIGQTVSRGQPVARADGPFGGQLHASISGVVGTIEEREVPLFTSTARQPAIVIEGDGQDRAYAPPGTGAWPEDRSERLQCIRDGGIVGLGGALYPTAAKLTAAGRFEILIVNGAECEPYISCDDLLMREAPEEVVRGAALLAEIAGAEQCIIAIERDKPLAIKAISAAATELETAGIRIAELPSIYPAGGERQLIEVLTGREVPSRGYPSDIGCLCQNVGTAYAVERLARLGEPLISRIVTVTGTGIGSPANVEARIGTPIAELVAFCGGYTAEVTRLIHGGSMMGYALPADTLPVTKATNCVIAARHEELRRAFEEWPCIRCGDCASACPARLQPQELLVAARAGDFDALGPLGLRDCIECGICDVACPSQIPLTEAFRRAKAGLRDHESLAALSAESERRFHAREQRRLQADAESRRRQEALKLELESAADKSETIAAAVARARRRKSRVGDTD